MHENIPFSIIIKKKEYTGYLQTTDTTDPPKVFFVFLNNFIVGDLMCRDKWIFDQGGRHKILGHLNIGELEFIAEYLGNIVVMAYE